MLSFKRVLILLFLFKYNKLNIWRRFFNHPKPNWIQSLKVNSFFRNTSYL